MIKNRTGIPAYSENAVLKLLIACGSGYAIYKLIYAAMLVAEAAPGLFDQYFTANIAMPVIGSFPAKVWTVLTYSWIHEGFWILFSNMVWLYAFGSLVQMLIGHRQLIPMFVYCMISGGIFYQLAQLIPGAYFNGTEYMMGAQAGVVGLSVAALTISPSYRVYLSDTFGIPLVVIAIVFYALQLMNANVNYEGAHLFLLLGGALMGYLYIVLLRNGYKPGDWVYTMFDKINNRFEPDERAYTERRNVKRNKTISMYSPKPKQGITQNNIDAILDKINQKGYDSLSKEDKETLMKASGSNNN